MEELTKKELLDYLEEISQQLNNIALDQIPFAISELYFKLENSIPISLIEKKKEELEKQIIEFKRNLFKTKNEIEKDYWRIQLSKAIAKRSILQELLDE